MWVYDSTLANLPYPIALPVSRARQALALDVPDTALLGLFRAVEESLRFATTVLLASLLAEQIRPREHVVELMTKKKTFGDRQQLLVHLVKSLPNEHEVMELRRGLERKGTTNLSHHLAAIAQVRNRLMHDPPRSATDHRQPLELVLKHIDALSGLWSFFECMDLVSVFQAPPTGSTMAMTLPWMGPVPGINEKSHDVGEAQSSGLPLRPGHVLWRLGSKLLMASPLILVRDDPACDEPEMYILERFVVQRDGELGAEWVNLASADRPSPSGGEAELGLVHDRLGAWLSAGPRVQARGAKLSRYFFGSTPLLMDRLLSRYVDRQDVPSEIDGLMQSQQSGSFWIISGPGAGKSTILSVLAERYQAIHHFVSQTEGRNNQPAILRSLIAQLLLRIDSEELPEAGDDLLPQQLANLLVRQALRGGRPSPTVLVIDAIDELGDEEAVSRFMKSLPSELPSGVYIVFSSRPLPPGIVLPVEARRFELKPLSVEDIRRVAIKHDLKVDATVCERAFVASGGNPLVAVWALTLLRDAPDRVLSVSDGFEWIMGPILAGPMTSGMSSEVTSVLAILAATQRPLDLSSISAVTGLRRAQTRDVIKSISGVLSTNGGEVSLVHKTVRDYLLDRRSLYGLEVGDVLAAHQSLGRLAESNPTSYPAVLMPWHAVRARDPGMLNKILASKNLRDALTQALLELAATDMDAVAEVVTLLPPDALDVALDTVTGLCEMRMPLAAAALLSMPWARSLAELDRVVLDMGLAVATENVQRAIDLARTAYPKLLAQSAAPSIISRAAFLFGDGLRIQGHHEEAANLYEEAMRAARPGSPNEFLASFQIADIDYVCGRLQKAGSRLESLLSAARTQGNVLGEIRVLRELGHLPLAREVPGEASALYSEALDLALIAGREGMLGECYVSLAESLVEADARRAIEAAAVGANHSSKAGASREVGKSLYVRASALLHFGEPLNSLEFSEHALRTLTESQYGSGMARAHLAASQALCALGRFDDALSHVSMAYDYYKRERIYPQHWAKAILILRQIAGILGPKSLTEGLEEIKDLPNIFEFPRLAPSSG